MNSRHPATWGFPSSKITRGARTSSRFWVFRNSFNLNNSSFFCCWIPWSNLSRKSLISFELWAKQGSVTTRSVRRRYYQRWPLFPFQGLWFPFYPWSGPGQPQSRPRYRVNCRASQSETNPLDSHFRIKDSLFSIFFILSASGNSLLVEIRNRIESHFSCLWMGFWWWRRRLGKAWQIHPLRIVINPLLKSNKHYIM